MQPDERVIQDIVERITRVVTPERTIMFGSGARGAMGRNSDIDLLIVAPGVHRRRTTAQIHRQMKGAGYPVDVLVVHPEDLDRFGDSPAFIFHEALTDGKEIYAA